MSMPSDLRSAWRSLWKTPLTSAGAVLTLGLGIGSTTAIFGLFNAILLRPLPYPDAERLVEISSTVQRQTVERRRSSFPDYFDWRDRTRSFDGVAAWESVARIVRGAGQPTEVESEIIDGPYLELLGARPVAGRLFHASDHRVDAKPAAVVNETFWTEQLERAPDVIGRPLRLGDTVYTIVGVVPAAFRGLSDQALVWIPAAPTLGGEALTARGSRGLDLLARLKPDVSPEQAQADIHRVSAQLARDFPATNEGRSARVVPLAEAAFGRLRPVVGLLFAVTLAVLLIACANVASLLLARGEGRRHEMSLRRALGSSESRLVRLLVGESALLVVAGVLVGSLLAQWTGAVLLALSPVQLPSFALPAVDWRMGAFVAAAGIAITLALGVIPLVASRRVDLVRSLREDAVQARAGGGGRGLRTILVTQVAVALVLLVGAALLGRSLVALLAFDPGYAPDGVLTFRVQPARSEPPPAAPAAALPSVTALAALDAIRSVPGVANASFTTSVPLVDASANSFVVENMPPVDETSRPRTYVHFVTPGYFETLGMAFREGRDFTAADLDPDSRVVIVSENLSKRFWPDQSAIGRRITRGRGGDDAQWLTIVGVVEETTLRGIPRNQTSDPDIFLPFDEGMPGFAVLLRTGGDAGPIFQRAREVLLRELPGAAVFGERSLRALVDERLAPARFLSWLTGWFAGMALLLAVIGIYGTLSYWVSRRQAEIAVRSALGASRWRVVCLVVGQAAMLAFLGVAAGLLLARGVSAILERALFGVGPADSVSFVGATLVMLISALSASLIPALRAARLNPTAALRGGT
jgi:predicted permease